MAWSGTKENAATSGTSEARTILPRIEAAQSVAQADKVVASLQEVVRQIGWFLLRRAQLVREGRPPYDCMPALHPLVQACNAYYTHVRALSEHLLFAQVQLEQLLDRADAPVPTDSEVSMMPETAPVSQIDLYQMISSIPMASAQAQAAESAPAGASAATAISLDDTPGAQEPAEQDTVLLSPILKRRKVDDSVAGESSANTQEPISLDTSVTASNDPLSAAGDMLDLSWIDFGSLGDSNGGLDDPTSANTTDMMDFDASMLSSGPS